MTQKMFYSTAAGFVMAIGLSITSYAATGWQQEGNDWRYFQRDNEVVTNTWKKSGNDWFYLGGDGRMVRSQLVEDGDNYYYVNSSGVRVANQWRKLPNEEAGDEEPDELWYYFQSNRKAYKAPESGRTSFKSIVTASGETKKYAFDSEGRMLFGWVNEESQRVTGDEAWKEGVYYCGDEDDGAMVQAAWKRLEAMDSENEDSSFDDEYWFYFNTNGKKVTGTKKNINGRKYLFGEYGNAKYDWQKFSVATDSNATPPNATPSNVNSYYTTPEQCWLAVGWFRAVPSEEIDAQSHDDDEKYWFYGLSNGGVVTSQLKTIKGHTYGFNEKGMMLHGLYKMEVDGKKILSCEKIENESQLPSAGDKEKVYYFGDTPKEGVMKTGRCTIDLDGEKFTYYFKTSGADRGAGVQGIHDGGIYDHGKLQTIEPGMRYGIIKYEGKDYLVNQSGKIQKNKKNVKDADEVYYSTDKNGIVTSTGNKQ